MKPTTAFVIRKLYRGCSGGGTTTKLWIRSLSSTATTTTPTMMMMSKDQRSITKLTTTTTRTNPSIIEKNDNGCSAFSERFFANNKASLDNSAGFVVGMTAVAAAVAWASAVVSSSSTASYQTYCEENHSQTTGIPQKVSRSNQDGYSELSVERVLQEEEEEITTPLWPDGVNTQDIEDLVDEILNDPNVNMPLIPDALERRLYKSTIQLTLNSFYAALSTIDGLPFLSHQIQIKRYSIDPGCDKGNKKKTTTKTMMMVGNGNDDDHHQDSNHDHRRIIRDRLVERSKDVNVQVLEEVADRLLENPAINMSYIPDSIERQVYSRCMVVIFRVLTVLFSSFRVTVCGHDFGLRLEPAVFETAALNAATSASSGSASSSLSRIDLEKLRQHAESCGVPKDDDTESLMEGWSVWNRIWNRREFMTQLHASLYGLILGIFDDIMANTQIHVLSDRITLDIIPRDDDSVVEENDDKSSGSSNKKINEVASSSDSANDVPDDSRGSVSVANVSSAAFIAGLGLGLTLSALVTK